MKIKIRFKNNRELDALDVTNINKTEILTTIFKKDGDCLFIKTSRIRDIKSLRRNNG